LRFEEHNTWLHGINWWHIRSSVLTEIALALTFSCMLPLTWKTPGNFTLDLEFLVW